MGPLDALGHLVNFFLPAVGVGLMGAVFAKLAWRRALRTVSLRRLVPRAVAAGAGALVVGLLVFGQDGRMATYALLVVACAATIWWVGLRRGVS